MKSYVVVRRSKSERRARRDVGREDAKANHRRFDAMDKERVEEQGRRVPRQYLRRSEKRHMAEAFGIRMTIITNERAKTIPPLSEQTLVTQETR